MANTDVTQREGYERSDPERQRAADPARLRARRRDLQRDRDRDRRRCSATPRVQAMEGWAQWLVFGVLIVFTGRPRVRDRPEPGRRGPVRNRHRRL